jgi:hypothetical protein
LRNKLTFFFKSTALENAAWIHARHRIVGECRRRMNDWRVTGILLRTPQDRLAGTPANPSGQGEMLG